MYPFLNLAAVELDPELVRRLPQRIAYYHLALPIAEDTDGVTVALVHPDSQRALDLLKTYLGEQVIPVRATPEAVRSKLDSVWQSVSPSPHQFVCWAKDPHQLEPVKDHIQDLLLTFSENGKVAFCYDSLDSLPAESADLIAVISPDDAMVDKLFQLPCTILFVYRADFTPDTILQVLRGHTPDHRVLDWIIPFAQRYEASVRLLTGVESRKYSPVRSSVVEMLSSQTERRYHVDVCRQILAGAGIRGQLKIRQESLSDAVKHELEEQAFSLVAIAAEAHGDFAQQVWRITKSRTDAFLVVKP
jgi:nucleotide-binding universal stress UspA family protein